jgi:glycosyltransferase involved in cell wall biosynthesis
MFWIAMRASSSPTGIDAVLDAAGCTGPSSLAATAAVRVGLFTDADVFAGTERHILDLARGLREEGAQIVILCPTPSPLADRASDDRFVVVSIPKAGLIDTNAIRTVYSLLKDQRLDVVHAHNGRTAVTASIAATWAGRGRCVATQHFLSPNRTLQRGVKGILSRAAHRWVSSRTHRHIAVSQAALAGMIQRQDAPQDRITVIPNGIVPPAARELLPRSEVRAELRIAPHQPLIVCVARLVPEKDIDTLIDAMKLVVAQRPDARCVVAGEGDLRPALEKHIRDAGVENAIQLLGFRSDTLSLIHAADLFVLPSKAEPFGLVLLEAMSLGRPVIATAAGGPLEIVVESGTGLLVAPENPQPMADAIVRLIDDPALRDSLGDAGRQRFLDNYTVTRMAKATMDVYRQTLAN